MLLREPPKNKGLKKRTNIFLRKCHIFYPQACGLTVLVIMLCACKMEGELSQPELTTFAAVNITPHNATLGGNIIDAGTPEYAERGVVYATTRNPTVNNNKKIIAGTGTGNFSDVVTGLTHNTVYYTRAYALNKMVIVYGEQVSFRTSNITTITITAQPAPTTNVTAGSITGSLTVGASVNQGATLSYQWYRTTSDSNTGGTIISGATNESYAIPATLTAGTYYYFCEVSATEAIAVRSDVATVNVTSHTVPVITITTQPAPTTNVTEGSITGNLTVGATVTQGATLSYQWYRNTSNSNTDGTVISGATNASYPIPATLTPRTYYYFCELSATGGATTVRSNVATVNVSGAVD